jgi:hypothetical protein
MSDDRMKIDKNRIKAFSNQALDIAITRRVNFVQKHKKDFQSLEVELAQLWVAVEHCYQRKDWERLITFREALQPFLDLRGFWSHSLTLSQWAQEAAQAQGDIFGEARYIHEQANILSLQGNYREA